MWTPCSCTDAHATWPPPFGRCTAADTLSATLTSPTSSSVRMRWSRSSIRIRFGAGPWRARDLPVPRWKAGVHAPELQGKRFTHIDRETGHDHFGLAVLIFQLLMEGTHPFAGLYTSGGDPPPYEDRIAAGFFSYGNRRGPYRPIPIAPPFEMLDPALRSSSFAASTTAIRAPPPGRTRTRGRPPWRRRRPPGDVR